VANRCAALENLVTARALACCRACGRALSHLFVDLGLSPFANDYLRPDQLDKPERVYPLRVYVCEGCLLVQIEEFEAPDTIFNDHYAYFSSYSDTWVEHARRYADMMVARFGLNASHHVVEIASNDGYLLQWFHAKEIPVLGIEPSSSTAAAAEAKGIPSLRRFFGRALADELVEQGRGADVLIGNNVLAHVPDIMDFVAGIARVLKPDGVVTLEFPHFLNLYAQGQFDTIYHEHFSYLSLLAVRRIFASQGLAVFDVEELPTHGGSLRVFARHAANPTPISERVERVLENERAAGLERLDTYRGFGARAEAVRTQLVGLLSTLKRNGRTVAGYGAPAKGNTLLNYCGISTDVISFTVDRNPAKQHRFLPGSRIPVFGPEHIWSQRPDYVVILPWNLKDEVIEQMAGIRDWGGQFIVPIPEPTLIP
jgi:2-polyprenyl-3-methyl-5-hydroxy-6-metoxy-1,4-benzoquinol methylase